MVAEQRARTAELVGSLSPQVRLAVLHTTAAVARADDVVSRQEEQAVEVVADALGFADSPQAPTEDLPAAFDGLSGPERELVYACGAWLAGADSVTDAAEAELLGRLRAALRLDESTADALQAKVDTLRLARSRYLPRSEQLPWWEEFGELLRRLSAEAVDAAEPG